MMVRLENTTKRIYFLREDRIVFNKTDIAVFGFRGYD